MRETNEGKNLELERPLPFLKSIKYHKGWETGKQADGERKGKIKDKMGKLIRIPTAVWPDQEFREAQNRVAGPRKGENQQSRG